METDGKVFPPLTPRQQQLYKERQQLLPVSKTWKTSDLYSLSGISQKYEYVTHEVPKTPWGRHRSYGGLAPLCLPTESRPKCEPPPLMQKGHHHFGSGLGPFPRGIPIRQQYDVTLLRRSYVRTNDELLPRPQTTVMGKEQLETEIPREHAFSSHMSRQALFPSHEIPKIRLLPEEKLDDNEEDEEDSVGDKPGDKPGDNDNEPKFEDQEDKVKAKSHPVVPLPLSYPERPPFTVMHKARGSFGRRELVPPYTPNLTESRFMSLGSIATLPLPGFFSKHEVITQFNKRYNSITPAIMTRQGRRPADWHMQVGISSR